MKVALFATCLGDTLFPEAPKATVALLERLGCDVEFPEEQTCCGQMHLNTGYRREAVKLGSRFAAVFAGADAVVAPSGSCAATVREEYPRLGVDRLPPVFELSGFLVGELGVEDVGAYYPHRVTYHPTCHSLRSLRVGDAPVRLLRQVRGIDLVGLPDAEQCCGFGGTFALKQAETSAAMLADKVRGVLDTGAEILTASDSSCLMHIGGALERQRTGVRCVHLAEILASTEQGLGR
jgi:L-lactate dehydrogenase complex protein LldE